MELLIAFFSYIVPAISFVAALYLYLLRNRRPLFPVVNACAGDYTGRKSHALYEANARELIANGLAEHDGPITILTISGPKVILPSSLWNWVKSNKDLDHPELVKEDYMAGSPGFEAQTILHHDDHLLVNVIKSKLSKNEHILPILNAGIQEALSQHWGNGSDWHAIDWQRDTTGIISGAAAAVSASPALAQNDEWQQLTVNYTMSSFMALGPLKAWPAPLRSVAHYFHPLSRSSRRLMSRARDMTKQEVDRRRAMLTKASEVGMPAPVHDDGLEWIRQAVNDRDVDHGALQLALAIAALFTTSEALRQTILELCKHQELIPDLREEIQQAVSQLGWTTRALFRMELLDSVMKEAQRTLPALGELLRQPLCDELYCRLTIAAGLERKAIRDTFLPNGVKIPKGTHIAVDASPMWDPAVYDAPESFDGRRLLRLRDAGRSAYMFTAASREHQTFGAGRSIYPGRFFADVELKLCLAHMLQEYDFRLGRGSEPKSMYAGIFPVVDPTARVEVRRACRPE